MAITFFSTQPPFLADAFAPVEQSKVDLAPTRPLSTGSSRPKFDVLISTDSLRLGDVDIRLIEPFADLSSDPIDYLCNEEEAEAGERVRQQANAVLSPRCGELRLDRSGMLNLADVYQTLFDREFPRQFTGKIHLWHFSHVDYLDDSIPGRSRCQERRRVDIRTGQSWLTANGS